MRPALVALALLCPATSVAQDLEARALFPYTQRAESLNTVVVTARPREPVRGDVLLQFTTTWPYGELRVRHAVSLGAGSLRTLLVPVPAGQYDSGFASIPDTGGPSSAVVFGSGGGSVRNNGTWFAVVGLGGRVTAAIQAVNPTTGDARVVAATGLTDTVTGDPIFPPIASAYGGTHVVVAGAGAILTATPEARRALRDWVMAGGFLAVSPRTVADLRDPWFTELLGVVTDDGGGRLSGARLYARRWGSVVHVGLGVVGVIPYDLSLERWSQNGAAETSLRDFVDFADGSGGGMVAPGDLELFRRFSNTGGDPVRDAFRPVADVRGLLIPVTIMLALYVIGVGVVMARNRKAKAPLKIFVRLPLVALGVLAAVFVSARVTRPSSNTARVLAVYDLGADAPRAMERVFVGLTAGSASTLSIQAPTEGFALYRTGASSASSAMRWDGQRLGVERVRLGLWESGLAYTERVVDAASGLRVLRRDGAVMLQNRSPWTIERAAYVSGDRVAYRFAAVPVGATVAGEAVSEASVGGAYARLFGAQGAPNTLAQVFVDNVVGPYTRARAADQVFALARLPDDVRAMVRGLGFTPKVEGVLVRVVIPTAHDDAERVGAYSGRLGVRRATYGGEEEEPVEEDTPQEPPIEERAPGDGGAGDASMGGVR